MQLLVGTQAWPYPDSPGARGRQLAFRDRAGRRGDPEPAHRPQRSAVPSPCCEPTRPPSRNTHRSIATATACSSSRRSWPARPASSTACTGPRDTSRGETPSPFGPLIAESSPYLAGHKRGDPYRGYHFRILTRQGKNAPGGAYSYVINGRMVAGAAMVAYPATLRRQRRHDLHRQQRRQDLREEPRQEYRCDRRADDDLRPRPGLEGALAP